MKLCAYRGEDGLKCAIGCLIPDSEYSEKIEGGGVHFLVSNTDMPPSLRGVDLNLLNQLQTVHDQHDPLGWENGLKDVARAFNLKVEWEWT